MCNAFRRHSFSRKISPSWNQAFRNIAVERTCTDLVTQCHHVVAFVVAHGYFATAKIFLNFWERFLHPRSCNSKCNSALITHWSYSIASFRTYKVTFICVLLCRALPSNLLLVEATIRRTFTSTVLRCWRQYPLITKRRTPTSSTWSQRMMGNLHSTKLNNSKSR
jgi:hypothetical protein